MKQMQLDTYRPNYPKKLIRGAVLTAAAMVTLGSSLGCVARFETTTSGAVAIDGPTETPEVMLTGEIAIDEPAEEPQIEGYMIPEDTQESGGDKLMLSGDVMVAP